MRSLILALCLLCAAVPALAADEPAPPWDMTVLTVGGMIGKTNRGPLDAKCDSLLALQKIDFKDAFAFDRATLLSLPQGTVTRSRASSTSLPPSVARCCARCSAI